MVNKLKKEVEVVINDYNVEHSKTTISEREQQLLTQIEELMNEKVTPTKTTKEVYLAQFKKGIKDKMESSILFRLTLPLRSKVTVKTGFFVEYSTLTRLHDIVHEYWDITKNKPVLLDKEYQLYATKSDIISDVYNWFNLTGYLGDLK